MERVCAPSSSSLPPCVGVAVATPQDSSPPSSLRYASLRLLHSPSPLYPASGLPCLFLLFDHSYISFFGRWRWWGGLVTNLQEHMQTLGRDTFIYTEKETVCERGGGSDCEVNENILSLSL